MGEYDPTDEEMRQVFQTLERFAEARERGDDSACRAILDTLPDWYWALPEVRAGLESLVPDALDFLKQFEPERLIGILERLPHLQHRFPRRRS